MKNFKHTFCLCCLLLAVVTPTQAQKNPQRGFIVMNGDTITGTIDFLSRKKCAESCLFKKDGATDFKTYSPKDITAYSLMDNTVNFISKTFSIDGDDQQIFAECLLKGCISLYRYEEAAGDATYLLEDATGKIVALKDIEHKDQLTTEDALQKKRQMLYPAMEMLSESKEAQSRLWNVSLTASNLVSIIRDYDKQYCEGSQGPVVFEYKAKNSSASKIHLTAEVGKYFTSYKFDSGITATAEPIKFGIGAEIYFPRVNNNLSLQIMASYYQCTSSISYYQEDASKEETIATEEFEDRTITLLCGVNYTFLPKKTISPFVCGGITMPFCISEVGLTEAIYQKRDATDRLTPFNLCLYLGGGINLNQFRIFGRYEVPVIKGFTEYIKPGLFIGASVVI